MLDRKIRAAWDTFMRPVGHALARTGVTANAITATGLVVQVVAAIAILQGKLLLAGLIAIVAALSDALDGALAKAQGATKFGALLDSTSDRFADALFFLPLAWLYGVAPDVASREQPWTSGLALGALVFSFLVSYVKARAEGLGFECKIGIVERFERIALMVVGLIFDIVLAALAILTVLSAITFLQRLLYVRKQASLSAAP